MSYKSSIARSIWDIDPEQVKNIGEGILSLPNVEYIEIRDISNAANKQVIQLSTGTSENLTTKDFTLKIEEDGELLDVGKLSLKITLSPLYSDLYDKLLFILTFQTIKAFSVSILIFAIFHYLVTQHLITMASFSQNIKPSNLDQELVLNRNQPSVKDELDEMSNALNSTKLSLKKMLESNSNSMQLQHSLEKERAQKELQTKYNLQTEQRNIELAKLVEELKNTQEQLVNSEKMAALGNMVQGISHELNTPIGISITGSSHLKNQTTNLSKKYKNGTMTKADLELFFHESENLSRSIDISLQKASSLIQSFKLVSVEQHQDSLSEFNVHKNFEDIVYSLLPSLSHKNIQIINNIPKDIQILSYPGIFYQIYTNLINNAQLHGFQDQQQGLITLDAKLEAGTLSLIFKDDGKGMSEDVKQKLFDPFFTTKRGSGGTGLGMNIVMNLITEKLLGQVNVETEVGAGTCFYIQVKDQT